jgi:hypothetical protein
LLAILLLGGWFLMPVVRVECAPSWRLGARGGPMPTPPVKRFQRPRSFPKMDERGTGESSVGLTDTPFRSIPKMNTSIGRFNSRIEPLRIGYSLSHY